MDNQLTSSTSIVHASTLWALATGRKPGKDAVKDALCFVLGSTAGNVAEQGVSNLLSAAGPNIFQQQPKTPRIIERWRRKFEPRRALTERDALRFIIDLCNGVETNLDTIFGPRFVSGSTKLARGAASDVMTHRLAGQHSGWTLQLTVDGAGAYNCLRRKFKSEPGDLVLLSPEALYDYGRAPEASNWAHHWIYFPDDRQLTEWMNWPEIGPGIYHTRAQGGDYQKMHALFEETFAIADADDGVSNALLKNLTEQILIRASQFSGTMRRECADRRITRAQSYICLRLRDPITVDDVARHIGMSRSNLSRLFKTRTGLSLIEWRNERRMGRACRLLASSDRRIGEIAETVGFDDPLYFSRIFARTVGCSPRQYRRRKHADIANAAQAL